MVRELEMTEKSSVKSLTWCLDDMAVFGLWAYSLSHLIGNLGETASGWRSVLVDFWVSAKEWISGQEFCGIRVQVLNPGKGIWVALQDLTQEPSLWFFTSLFLPAGVRTCICTSGGGRPSESRMWR